MKIYMKLIKCNKLIYNLMRMDFGITFVGISSDVNLLVILITNIKSKIFTLIVGIGIIMNTYYVLNTFKM